MIKINLKKERHYYVCKFKNLWKLTNNKFSLKSSHKYYYLTTGVLKIYANLI